MSHTHFDKLLALYITGKTSAEETLKMKVTLTSIRRHNIQLLSVVAEELLYQMIIDHQIVAIEIDSFITTMYWEWLKGKRDLVLHANERMTSTDFQEFTNRYDV